MPRLLAAWPRQGRGKRRLPPAGSDITELPSPPQLLTSPLTGDCLSPPALTKKLSFGALPVEMAWAFPPPLLHPPVLCVCDVLLGQEGGREVPLRACGHESALSHGDPVTSRQAALNKHGRGWPQAAPDSAEPPHVFPRPGTGGNRTQASASFGTALLNTRSLEAGSCSSARPAQPLPWPSPRCEGTEPPPFSAEAAAAGSNRRRGAHGGCCGLGRSQGKGGEGPREIIE